MVLEMNCVEDHNFFHFVCIQSIFTSCWIITDSPIDLLLIRNANVCKTAIRKELKGVYAEWPVSTTLLFLVVNYM